MAPSRSTNDQVVFDDAFFRQLQRQIMRFYRFLEDNAIFGVIILVIGLIVVVLQQVILILLYPFR